MVGTTGPGWGRLVIAMLCAALAAGAAACGGGDGSGSTSSAAATSTTASGLPDLSGKTITYYGFGGAGDDALKKALFEPFEKATGAKVVVDGPVDYAKVQAQIKAKNVSYDVVDGDDSVWAATCGKDWLRLDGVDQSQVDPAARSITPCGAPDYGYQYLIAYSKKAFPNGGPKTCQDFFDTKRFPGKRGIWSYPVAGQLECAAIAAGADAANPYPIDIDAAIAKIKAIKGDLSVYQSSQNAIDQMQNGDTVMGIYSGRTLTQAVQAGADWQAAPGSTMFQAYGSFAIPNGSKNVEAAKALLSYMLKAENGARFQREIGKVAPYSGVTTPLQPGDPSHVLPKGPAVTKLDWKWWAPNYSKGSDALAGATTG
jgi:putative spermidine/putrescine transport system substrate-binding protein